MESLEAIAEDRLSLLNASFDGARIVTLVAEPSDSERPGTPLTAAANDDRDEVAPSKSTKDMLEFCAAAMVAKAANGRSVVYIVRLVNVQNIARHFVMRRN